MSYDDYMENIVNDANYIFHNALWLRTVRRCTEAQWFDYMMLNHRTIIDKVLGHYHTIIFLLFTRFLRMRVL